MKPQLQQRLYDEDKESPDRQFDNHHGDQKADCRNETAVTRSYHSRKWHWSVNNGQAMAASRNSQGGLATASHNWSVRLQAAELHNVQWRSWKLLIHFSAGVFFKSKSEKLVQWCQWKSFQMKTAPERLSIR